VVLCDLRPLALAAAGKRGEASPAPRERKGSVESGPSLEGGRFMTRDLELGATLGEEHSVEHAVLRPDEAFHCTTGTGTFGRVRLALHKTSKMYYALKIMKKTEVWLLLSTWLRCKTTMLCRSFVKNKLLTSRARSRSYAKYHTHALSTCKLFGRLSLLPGLQQAIVTGKDFTKTRSGFTFCSSMFAVVNYSRICVTRQGEATQS
jgi:hypothetical protein